MDIEPSSTANAADASASPVRRARFMFEATLADVSRVAQALRLFLPPEASEEVSNEIEIGVVEAMSNIVRHGYGNSNAGVIEVSYDYRGAEISIELRDRGIPMPADALQGKADSAFDFDPEDIEHLPESGMGLALMKASFDRIDYQSDGQGNLLRLVKTLPSGDIRV
jgi:serine/threonine-protein kinase RsbW